MCVCFSNLCLFLFCLVWLIFIINSVIKSEDTIDIITLSASDLTVYLAHTKLTKNSPIMRELFEKEKNK